jgi:hypothetical protein
MIYIYIVCFCTLRSSSGEDGDKIPGTWADAIFTIVQAMDMSGTLAKQKKKWVPNDKI